MNFEQIQSIKSEVKANIDQLQRFATLLPMLKIVRVKNTEGFSLLQEIKHKQVLQRVPDIWQQIEPHLLLLVNSEKLLDEAEEMSDEATDASLQELDELTQTIERIRISLFHAIDSVSNSQRYDLRYKYRQYQPVLNKKRGPSSEILNFQNTSLYSYGAKKFHLDTTQQQTADDIDLTCDEALDDDNPVSSFKK